MTYDQSNNAGADTQAAIDAGLAIAGPTHVAYEQADDPHVVVVPAGGRHEVLDLERFKLSPRRPKGRYTAATVDAFNAYVKAHVDESATTIWVHPLDGTVEAVLNDHGDGPASPEWRDWRVKLDLRHTEEWLRWRGRDGVLGDQVDFAEHIEDGLAEIADPSGAELLEIAQTFEATTSAQFRQASRLSDGRTQFRYDEEIDARAGTSGELTVPHEITLVLAPYLGEEPVELTARLRYRVSGGNLKIGYKLDRPDRITQEALVRIADRVGEQFAGRVFLGSPPA